MTFEILFIGFVIGGVIWCRNKEKKAYNGGICPNCGEPLRHFDDCLCGDRGYTCDKCNYTTWVSYNIDKPNRNTTKERLQKTK